MRLRKFLVQVGFPGMDIRFPPLVISPSYRHDLRDYLQYGLLGTLDFEADGPSAARLSDLANLAADQNHRQMGYSSWILHDEPKSVISSNKHGKFIYSYKETDSIHRETVTFPDVLL